MNTTNVQTNDNIITLNASATGSGSPVVINSGIEVKRNASTTRQFYWDEANLRWTSDANFYTAGNVVLSGTLDTGQGATEVYLMNQNVRTTDDVTFNKVTSTTGVYAAGASGFYSSTYAGNARNPIWRFGNADGYGLSYFQGTAGAYSNLDTIGIHMGTATAAGSQWQFNQADNSFRSSGPIYTNTGGNGGSYWLSDTGAGLYRDNTYDVVLTQNNSSGNPLYLAGAGNVVVSIDNNNNETDRKFIIGNNAVKSTNELFSVNESGTGYASNDFRAPIFYDSANTGYYLDPNGSTSQVSLKVATGLTYSDSATQYVGYIATPNDYPSCTETARIYTIGTLNAGGNYNTQIEIEVIGSHRGYTTTSYVEYKKWEIYVGDRISSNLVFSAGSNNNVGLWNGSNSNGLLGINGDHVASGWVLRLIVNPNCGAGLNYTVRVRYTNLNLTHGPFTYTNHSAYSVSNPTSAYHLNGTSAYVTGDISGLAGSETLATVTNRGNISTGDIYTPSAGYHFRARYTAGNNNYHSSLNWYGLQLGNNGDNFLIAGRTNTGGRFRFYVNNTSDFTSINGTEGMRLDSDGRLYSYVDTRSPIFYNYSDTTYYIDGESTSVLNSLLASKLRSDIHNTYDDTFLFRSGTGTGTTRHINLGNSTSDPSSVGSASGISSGQRSDNQPYYLVYVKSPYNNGYATYTRLSLGWHTGVEIGGASAYGGTRIMDNSPGISTTELMSIGAGDSHVRITNNLYVPIVYDRDDTNYYSNPGGTSIFSRLTFGNSDGSNHRNEIIMGSVPSWGTSGKAFMTDVGNYGVDNYGLILQAGYNDGGDVGGIKITDDGVIIWGAGDEDLFRIYNEDTSYLSMQITDGNNVNFQQDVRSPIYYDYNDTSYRIDGNGDSRLWQLGIGYGLPSKRLHVIGDHGNSAFRISLLSSNNGSGQGEVMLQGWVSEPGNTWNGAGFGYNVDNNYNGGTNQYYWGRPNTTFGQGYFRFEQDGGIYVYNTNTSGTRYTNQYWGINYTYVYNYLEAGSSLRAPIFYDSYVTSWRVDPTDYSYLRYLKVRTGGSSSGTRALSIYAEGQGEINFGSYPGAWTSALQIQSNDNNYYMWLSPLTGYNGRIVMMNAGLEIYTQSNNFSAVFYNNQMRTGFIYDSDDTGYYLDHNGFSNFGRNDGQVVQITKTGSAPGNNSTLLVRNQYGNHSWGITGEFRIEASGGGDRPSILFSNGYDSNTWTCGYGYADSSYFRINHDHGWRNGSWGTTDFYVDRGGNSYSNGSSRAPIFYDQNDTGYYLDPNGVSNDGAIQRGGTRYGPNWSWGTYFRSGTNGRVDGWAATFTTNGDLHLQCRDGYATYINHYNGNITYTYDLRPTIIYDQNDTYYQVDPNGTVRVRSLYVNDWIYHVNGHGRLYLGGNTHLDSLNGHSIYFNYYTNLPMRYFGHNYYYGYDHYDVSTGYANGSYRAPIFYDNNDTGYYVDPNYPWENAGRWRGGHLHGPNPSWGAYFRSGTNGRVDGWASIETTNGNLHLDCRDGYETYINHYNGNRTYLYEIRTNFIYDRDNTGYYSDPNGTSRMNYVIHDNVYSYSWIFSQNNIIAYYSDERLKTNLGPIEHPLDKVQKLNGFYYIENELARSFGYNDEKVQVGLSAQQVQAVLPEVVTLAPFDMDIDEETKEIRGSKTGENYLTVDYEKIVPLLVEAIKELRGELNETKEEVKELRRMIEEK